MSPEPVWATPRSPERPTFGRAVAKLAHVLGTPLMPWQRQVADVALEVMPDGTWAYRTIVTTVQRQAGKTTLIGPVHTHRCLTRQDVLTWFTAQKRQDARDTWLDVVKRIRRSPLAPPFVKLRESNGSESVTFPLGSTFRPFAPTEDALHGKANELVTVDELWAFDAEQGDSLDAAIYPTFTTTGGQFWGWSAAGTAASAYMDKLVDKGRAAVGAGQLDTVAFFEWALPLAHRELVERGIHPDATRDERDQAFAAILAAHPGQGFTLREDVLAQMLQILGPDVFLRGFCNLSTPNAERLIAAPVWTACQASTWPKPPSVALALDGSPDQEDAVINCAWRDAEGRARIDVADARPGTAWLVDRVHELRAAWKPVAIGYQVGGPVAHVADELARAGVELAPVGGRDYAAACASLMTGIRDTTVLHPGHPALDAAVAAAAKRNAGDGWVWDRREPAESIAALCGATIAAWVWDHRPVPLPRARVIVRSP